jgi:hypothetical protein
MGMSASQTLRRAAAIGVGVVAVALAVPAGPASADILCNVNQNTWVRDNPWAGSNVKYTIPAGGGFRLIGYDITGAWAAGNGNGGGAGWIPNDGRLYNCH